MLVRDLPFEVPTEPLLAQQQHRQQEQQRQEERQREPANDTRGPPPNQQPHSPPVETPGNAGESLLPNTFVPTSVVSVDSDGGGDEVGAMPSPSQEIHSSMTVPGPPPPSDSASVNLLSPEDMEYHRVSTTYSDASGTYTLESSLLETSSLLLSTNAGQFNTHRSSSATVSLFTAAMADDTKQQPNYEVFDGTTFWLDDPPPTATTTAAPTADQVVIKPTATQQMADQP